MKKTLPIILIIAIVLGGVAAFIPLSGGTAVAESVYKAEVAYNDFLLSGGDILRNFTFWVNQDAIKSGLSVAAQTLVDAQIGEVFGEIENDFKSVGYPVSYTEGSGFLEVSLEYYQSYTEQYIAAGKDGYEKPTSSSATQKGVFFNTTTVTRNTIYKNLKENSYSENSVLALLNTAVTRLSDISNVADTDIMYIYNYGTKYSTRLITSDADIIYMHKELNINIHKFAMDSNTMLREITLSQTSPNAPVWYGLVFGITAAVAAVIVGIAVYRSKKKRGNENDK